MSAPRRLRTRFRLGPATSSLARRWERSTRPRVVAWLLMVLASAAACRGPERRVSSICLPATVFSHAAPGVSAEQRTLDYWVDQLPAGAADEVLLDVPAIEALNRRNARTERGHQDVLGDAVAEPSRVEREVAERIEYFERRLSAGTLVEERSGQFGLARERMLAGVVADEVRAVHRQTTLWCTPMRSGLFGVPVDQDFDRNRCTGLHPGELVRVLRRAPDGWMYVNSGHSVGWLLPADLTPALASEDARAFREQEPRLVVIGDAGWLRMGQSFPVVSSDATGFVVRAPAASGLVEQRIARSAPVREGRLPFTRRNVWRLALHQLGSEYGWGGRNGHRDCSRLVKDIFAVFGLRLGRHSGYQADNGGQAVDLRGLAAEEKTRLIQEAGQRGVALLHMRGHIMIYLGSIGGEPFAISSISEYLRPCGVGHQTVRLDRVEVTDLELGRGTDRTSFIERMEKVAIFGS